MANYFENNEERRRTLRKYFNEKTNIRLRNAAMLCIVLCIILLGVALFCLDRLSVRQMLLLRGSAGLFALAFIILVGIRTYRVHSAYFADRAKHGREDK